MIPKRLLFATMLCLDLGGLCRVGDAQGRGIPNATPEQSAALRQMTSTLDPLTQRAAAARNELLAASLDSAQSSNTLKVKVDAVRGVELDLAKTRADAFAKIQSSPAKLSPPQVAALAATLGNGRGGGGGSRTSMPHVTPKQANAILKMGADLAAQTQAVVNARAALASASLVVPRDDASINSKADSVASAESALALARLARIAKMQASPDSLDAEQLRWITAAGGGYGYPSVAFTEPEPMSFNDHRGYVSLFDGVSLKGWDGNPKFWRVEAGAIVGESTPENPSGNTYIAYRDVTAKDFTLKFEMKVEGEGGSGFQYRSQTGIPWSRPIPANVTANVGPVNLNWMMTGPQADFWPSRVYTGQFYSENTPMGIVAWRGQVVEGAGLGAKRLMGNIGDRSELGKLVKVNDWNEYTVIARGGTFLHIVNGQLMAVMVDDDPDSNSNQPGLFGIEIEALTRVSVRNIWLKKLN